MKFRIDFKVVWGIFLKYSYLWGIPFIVVRYHLHPLRLMMAPCAGMMEEGSGSFEEGGGGLLTAWVVAPKRVKKTIRAAGELWELS